ncbi:hypothetical protein SFUMM280S_07508 [Streptomyces fumanus]
MTNCSPVAWMSTSVRPSVGRIRAVSPQTVCDLLSLVEMCAVSRQRRMASSVTSLSGAARTKLPATPRKTLIRPSRMARIEFTESSPCARGGSKPNSSFSASRKV